MANPRAPPRSTHGSATGGCSTARSRTPAISWRASTTEGTPAPRGSAWRHAGYGSIGVLSSQEQAAAVRALAKTRPYVDAERVAVWGWSGGGTNTLNLMFRYPDLYQVGMAVAPVPDQTLYDTIYQERYMGLPKENEKGYQDGSAINFAEGLRGRLLVVHGSGDDNVHYQGTERLVNRLVELGKSFDLMVYPNRTHAIDEGTGHEPAPAPAAGALPARASARGAAAMIAAIRSAWIWSASAALIVLWVPVLGVVRLFDRDPMRLRTGRWFRRLDGWCRG